MKRLIPRLLLLTLLLALSGCSGRSMDDIIAKEPNITGTVKVVTEDSILIALPKPSMAECWVPLDVEHPDSMTSFSVGDEVVVYYDGSIAESNPMQLLHVYAITLKTPANRPSTETDPIRMVMVNDALYLDTGRVNAAVGRCGVMDGEITSAVSPNQTPVVNNQSNFGTDFGYQYGVEKNTIEVCINQQWVIFQLAQAAQSP